MPDPTILAYDTQLTDPSLDFDLPRQRERFEALLPAGGRVLDLGCGSGWAARRLRASGLRAVGLDRSAGRLARARAGDRPTPLVLGDMRALPIALGSVDGVWACASLLHLPKADLPSALTAIHAVLRPSGALYLSLKAGAGEAWSMRGGAPRFFAYYADAELDRLLDAARFQVVDGWTDPAPPEDPTHPWLNRLATT